MAVLTVTLASMIVMEVTYESNVEYIVHAPNIHRLKAYYNARSGVEISLLRIKIYNQLSTQFGDKLGPMGSMLNMIWSFPLNWPPDMGEEINSVEKDSIQSAVKESGLQGGFATRILDEGSKIDINDLNSPVPGLREITKKLLINVFNGHAAGNEKFDREYPEAERLTVINNMIDWLDADQTQVDGGGNERAKYPDAPPRVAIFPPNRMFRSIDELRMVADMNPDFFELLKDRITVFGAKAINPNTATPEVLKAIDPSITDEVVDLVIKRRDDPAQGGPFTGDPNEFWNFINSNGARVPPEVIANVPITFAQVTNFRIVSTGNFQTHYREIEAVVFDLTKVSKDLAKKIKDAQKDPNAPADETSRSASTPAPGPGSAQNPTKGPPRIVYWSER